MSYENFKQTFWSKHIQTELGKLCVFDEFCDYKFEGEVKHGERLKILGVARPTIKKYTVGTPIDREVVADSSQFLIIDQAEYFNFQVDDIDKAQGTEGLMETRTKEASVGLAEKFDSYIASIVSDGTKLPVSEAITTPDQALNAVDKAYVKLWSNGVPLTEQTEIVVTPWFYNLIKSKITVLSTDNPDYIKRGIVGMYNNGQVKISNNIYNTGTYDNCLVRTKKAIASAKQINKVEPFRPHDGFEEALKGLFVFFFIFVRPKEAICLQVKES